MGCLPLFASLSPSRYDRLVQADMSSGDPIADWLSYLRAQWSRNQT
jgi:hypothetical protein